MQGYGNVTQYAAIGFIEIMGGKVACVSCWNRKDKCAYTYSKEGGIDPYFLLTITDQYSEIAKEAAIKTGYKVEGGDAWISKEADL